MLTRKYGDRSNWTRIVERRYAQQYIDAKDFKGYVTLIDMVKVIEPLVVTYEDEKICIVEDGYTWLFQFPENKHYAVTTVFNEVGKVVQWYIDINLENGVENGVPYNDDLFLDIVVLPSGKVIVLDEDELEEAWANGTITQEMYDLAWNEANRLLELINRKEFAILELADAHKELLEKTFI
ncbi:DUF402 domain-containing protein [Ornithinibacillus sp. 179-J 7C1 HS]|uniref:DUF402 domain-containing protein n=1 Tax=Ornithinibacillus sp. 179-J 7C1 HS TaxID=3142384 RepID=UPI00399FB9F6